MAEVRPSREEAFTLLKTYNQNEGLIKHALAVEAVMRYCARKRGQDEQMWGVIGLVHDLDYEQFPEQHCRKTEEILTSRNWPAEYIRAVVSHGWGICTDVEPQTDLEKTLYAMDELTGLVAATALVFVGLSGYAMTTRHDLSFMGGMLFVGILVAFLAGIAAVVFSMPALSLAVSAMFVLLMSGLILYETQQIVRGGETNYIMATVTLFVAIFNLFTSLLHLLGFASQE